MPATNQYNAQTIGIGVALFSPSSYPISNGMLPSWNTDGTFAGWVAPASPAGTGTELQYRSSATAFGAVSGSSWDGSVLTIPQIISTGSVDFSYGAAHYQWFGSAGIAYLAVNEEAVFGVDGITKAVGIGTIPGSAQLTVKATSSNDIGSFRDSSNNEILRIASTGLTTENLTINGTLVFNGTATQINSTNLTVTDPLIKLANGNGADTLDVGFYGLYVSSGSKYAGLFRDASDGKFRLFTALQEEPTTAVNLSGTGYTAGTLVVGTIEGNVTGNLTGNVTGAVNGVTLTTGGSATTFLNGAGAYATPDHGSIGGLSDDDHSQYALLAGRSGGQTLIGGTASGNNLTLQSTSHGTKSKILIGTLSAYDEVNDRLGIGTLAPQTAFQVGGSTNGATGAHLRFSSSRLIEGMLGSTVQAYLQLTNAIEIQNNVAGNEIYLGVQTGRVMTVSPSVQGVFINTFTAGNKCLVIKGAASQTGVMFQIQGVSTTSTREHAEFDTAAIDNTDATRKYCFMLRAYDTAVRECIRGWGDGTNGRVALVAPNAAPTDAQIANGQVSVYVDQTAHNLLFRVKYSDGTLKLGTVALV